MKTDIGEILCLVGTKKYRKDRKIGVGMVRTLFGTLADYQATSAMLVTTSSYSPGARYSGETQVPIKPQGLHGCGCVDSEIRNEGVSSRGPCMDEAEIRAEIGRRTDMAERVYH